MAHRLTFCSPCFKLLKTGIQINDGRTWPSVYDNCLTGCPLPTCAKLSARDIFPSLSAMMPWEVLYLSGQFSSVQCSRLVMSDSLRLHESQHAKPPCPSPTSGVHSKSRPSSQWCHPAISSSVVPFSSCPQSLPASGSFQWVNTSNEVAKVFEFQLQHQSFQWTLRTDLLYSYSQGLIIDTFRILKTFNIYFQ